MTVDVVSPLLTDPKPSHRLQAAAEIVANRPEQWAPPLVVLLLAEKAHAEDLERSTPDWRRYPETALLLRLADGLIAEADA